MRPVEDLEEAHEEASRLKERLDSVGREIREAGRGEEEISEELEQVEKVADAVGGRDPVQDGKRRSLEEEAVEDIRDAAERLEAVTQTLESIGGELGDSISGEESLLERLGKTFRRVKSGDYTLSGQGAEEFSDLLNAAASEVIKTEDEVQAAVREARKARDEGRRLLEALDSSNEEEGLEELEESLKSSVRRSEVALESFQSFREEMGEEVGSSSRRDFMRAAATVSTGAVMGFSGCAGLADQIQKAEEMEESLKSGNPLGTSNPVVSVEEGRELVEDFRSILENALRFWESHSDEFLGYSVDFSRNDSASSPDISIRVRRRIERCEDMKGAGLVGCCDLSGSSADIKIESGYEPGMVEETLKHELGHALGLGHGDAPQGVMSSNRSRRQDDTERKARIAKLFNRGLRLHNRGIESYRTGIELYRNEKWRRSREKFEEARRLFRRSSNRLEQAQELCRDIGEEDARSVVERGKTNAELMAEATGHLVDSIEAGFNGDRDRRERMFERYHESFREAREVDAPTGEELRQALEL